MKNIWQSIVLIICGFVVGIFYMIYRCGYILEGKQKRANKFYLYFNLLDQWMVCKEQNYKCSDYFHHNHIESVAIYGMGKLGKHLKHQLEEDGIQIRYVIDEGETIIYGKEEHYNLQDKLPLADLVIVTPIDEYEEIKTKILHKNNRLNVISISEFIHLIKTECEDRNREIKRIEGV
ncbi:hypothetical protein D7X88_16345 [bacterium C-53]|nr:hypothetical protein [Lachnospiraceae bacterium]NBI04527.1 hypothetical protein [Lachnospiraceae bacterium]RKJ08103.1 hypothetical protein D7X88_16345 [bacterium C-53]